MIAAAAVEEFGEMTHDPAATTAQRVRVIAGKLWQALKVSAAWLIINGFFLGFLSVHAYGVDATAMGVWGLLKVGAQVAAFAAVLAIFTVGGLASLVASRHRNPVAGTVLLGTGLVVLLGYLGFFTASL